MRSYGTSTHQKILDPSLLIAGAMSGEGGKGGRVGGGRQSF